jgi:hypothetical protein
MFNLLTATNEAHFPVMSQRQQPNTGLPKAAVPARIPKMLCIQVEREPR